MIALQRMNTRLILHHRHAQYKAGLGIDFLGLFVHSRSPAANLPSNAQYQRHVTLNPSFEIVKIIAQYKAGLGIDFLGLFVHSRSSSSRMNWYSIKSSDSTALIVDSVQIQRGEGVYREFGGVYHT